MLVVELERVVGGSSAMLSGDVGLVTVVGAVVFIVTNVENGGRGRGSSTTFIFFMLLTASREERKASSIFKQARQEPSVVGGAKEGLLQYATPRI